MVAGGVRYLEQGRVGERIGRLFLKMPLVGSAARRQLTAEALAFVAAYLEAGLPVHEALLLVARTTRNGGYRARLERAAAELARGQEWLQALTQSEVITRDEAALLSIQTGPLQARLSRLVAALVEALERWQKTTAALALLVALVLAGGALAGQFMWAMTITSHGLQETASLVVLVGGRLPTLAPTSKQGVE